MQQFHIVICHKRHRYDSHPEYYSQLFETETQQQAESKAIQSFRDDLPFLIKGEIIEVYSVDGMRKDQDND